MKFQNFRLILILFGVFGCSCSGSTSMIRFCNNSQGYIDVKLVEHVLRKHLSGHESVKVFDLDKTLSLDYEMKMLQTLQSITSVTIYEGINEALVKSFNDMGDELNVPSTTESYFVLTTSSALLVENLHLFSQINTNGKWVLVLFHVKGREVNALLVSAWRDHKMANILVLFSDQEARFYIKSYNPFVMNRGSPGKFWTAEIKHETIEMILKQIENIFEKKVTNLQDYQLKASIFFDTFKHNRILDHVMLDVFEEVLKTKFSFVQTTDGSNSRGNQLPNGTFTGDIK